MTELNELLSADWHSEQGAPRPKRFEVADDTLAADQAFKLASEGVGLLWQGDFHNAKQLIQALARRYDSRQKKKSKAPAVFPEAFHQHRLRQLNRSRLLGSVVIRLESDGTIALRRAPDVREAVHAAYGALSAPRLISLRELLGVVGSHEWQKKGVPIAALDASIYPAYGVFSPVRGEYLDLIQQVPLPVMPSGQLTAFDIGTGTGVIATLLAKRGVKSIIATENDDRAMACAAHNVAMLGLEKSISVQKVDMFPDGKADLIVCNPPWLPGKPSSSIEGAIFDPDHRMLKAFLTGVGSHLSTGGQAWLVMSDLAEHLKLRSPDSLTNLFHEAGLEVVKRVEIKPRHGKVADVTDPLHSAREQEKTSLWILTPQ